jgi:hypothetical protein
MFIIKITVNSENTITENEVVNVLKDEIILMEKSFKTNNEKILPYLFKKVEEKNIDWFFLFENVEDRDSFLNEFNTVFQDAQNKLNQYNIFLSQEILEAEESELPGEKEDLIS